MGQTISSWFYGEEKTTNYISGFLDKMTVTDICNKITISTENYPLDNLLIISCYGRDVANNEINSDGCYKVNAGKLNVIYKINDWKDISLLFEKADMFYYTINSYKIFPESIQSTPLKILANQKISGSPPSVSYSYNGEGDEFLFIAATMESSDHKNQQLAFSPSVSTINYNTIGDSTCQRVFACAECEANKGETNITISGNDYGDNYSLTTCMIVLKIDNIINED